MKCKFCAEEIQDAAILCRFCGAVKEDSIWKPPPARPVIARDPSSKTRTTIRVAGILYVLSSFFDLSSLNSAIPLIGAVRGGAVAIVYHLLYAALFLGMGVGLLRARQWGYRLVLAGTFFYTLDKLLYLLDGAAREAYLTQQLSQYEVEGLVDKGSLIQTMNYATVLFILCWWGFAAYLYVRRDYFMGSPRI